MTDKGDSSEQQAKKQRQKSAHQCDSKRKSGLLHCNLQILQLQYAARKLKKNKYKNKLLLSVE